VNTGMPSGIALALTVKAEDGVVSMTLQQSGLLIIVR